MRQFDPSDRPSVLFNRIRELRIIELQQFQSSRIVPRRGELFYPSRREDKKRKENGLPS